MFTPEQANAFAASWYAAWNAHDLDAIMSHYAPMIEHSSPFIPRYLGTNPPSSDTSIKTGAVVREYFEKALQRNPALRFDPMHVATGLQSVILIYRRMAGELAAEVFFFDQNGKVVRSVSHYG